MQDLAQVVINASGNSEDLKAFYETSYTNWENITAWENRKIHISFTNGIWRAWKKGDTYAIIGIGEASGNHVAIVHAYCSRSLYEQFTK
jgi:hypothetical protein